MPLSEPEVLAPLPDRRVAVVIAHPDDDVLGCGGTIARHVDEGAEVRILLSLRRSDPRGVEHWDSILEHFTRSCEILGAQPVFADPMLRERDADAEVRELQDVVLPVVEWAQTVYTHWTGDVHQVHRTVARSVEIATRPFRRRRNVNLFEVNTSTDQAFERVFSPQQYVCLTGAQAQRKLDAMACYTTEGARGRDLEDVERRMRLRGAEIGVDFAEAFVIARQFR